MSVEQAAERLRSLKSGGQPYPEDKRQFWCAMQAADEVTCGRAYLDLFDPTPLTEEILRASGWNETSYGWSIGSKHPTLYQTDCAKPRWFVRYMPNHITTVGDLRRLLSALHIDCAVVVPESEVGNG